MTEKFEISIEEIYPGEISYNDLSLDWNAPLSEQALNLKEDLFQASFPEGLLLDVGWYNFSDSQGFQINIVRNFNWLAPDFSKKAYSLAELKDGLEEAVNYCRKFAQ